MTSVVSPYLRIFSKWVCFFTFALIFLGGLVKSTESGLSVPDWPTTYGHFMFAFPLDQMVGGIKYEHTHRMLASIVGLLTLILCGWLIKSPVDTWIKRLGVWAVILVVAQGVLGGLTVKFFLPFWLSSMHGVLAQTFFLVLIMIAYGLSVERRERVTVEDKGAQGKLLRFAFIFLGMVYIQLILGNLMRHTESGLAIPDFPTMGGALWPSFSKEWLAGINQWQFEHNHDLVTMGQVHLHLTHRIWAFLILAKLLYINMIVYKEYLNRPLIVKTVFLLNLALIMQIMLGISTVLFQKEPITTTFHVACGALVLGISFLLLLRCAPFTCSQFKSQIKS